MNPSVFFGRQAVLDRKRRTYGYALIYRHGELEESFFTHPDDATNTAVELMMLEWGFDRVIGHRCGFVDVSTQFLSPELLAGIPADRGVAVIHDANLSESAIAAMRSAASTGVRFALTDLQHLDPTSSALIADLFSFVGIDIHAMDNDALAELVTRTKALFPQALLIAGNVDDVGQFDQAIELGFDLFQGNFFTEVEIVVERRRPTARSDSALNLIAAVHSPDVSIDQIAAMVGRDAMLTYEFFRLVNSSRFGLPVKVNSIHHAVMLVGLKEIRQFALALAMSTRSRSVSDEVLVLSATRASMAEALAGDDKVLAVGAFTAGLLSVIDVIFGIPMEELLADLPLAPAVHDALVRGAGDIGQILGTVYAFENADTPALARLDPEVTASLLDALAVGAAAGEALRSMLTLAA
jgi:EAL and modified HD-GYP domain-containing signal transduction protein